MFFKSKRKGNSATTTGNDMKRFLLELEQTIQNGLIPPQSEAYLWCE